MDGCCFQQFLQQNLGLLLACHRKRVLLKNGSRDFQNNPPFERSAYFYVTTNGNFERLQYFNFETNFLKNENLFQKNWSTAF